MLAEVVRSNAFLPSTDPVVLAACHVMLKPLTDKDIERELFQALTGDLPCAAEIVGGPGTGKSSCIMKVIRDVARLRDGGHEILLLTAGDVEGALTDTGAFLYHLIEVIRQQEFRFADPVQERLAGAGAKEETVREPVVTHTAGVDGGIPVAKVKYQATLQQRSKEYKFGEDPARSRGELDDIIKVMRDTGARPVVVIDDTDKFAPGDTIDEAAVTGLFDHAVQSLAELKIDFVIAVHQRFQDTDAYGRVAPKYLTTRLAVPYLLLERRPLEPILDRHLEAAGLEPRATELVDAAAIDTLQGLYVGRGRDLRQVLHVVHRAAIVADERRGDRITVEDISAITEQDDRPR